MSRLWFGQDAPMSPAGLAGESPSGRGAPKWRPVPEKTEILPRNIEPAGTLGA